MRSSDIQNSEDEEQVIIEAKDADTKTKKDVIVELFNTLINEEDYKNIEQKLKETLALLSFKQNKQTNNFEFDRENTKILADLCQNENFKNALQTIDTENNFTYCLKQLDKFNKGTHKKENSKDPEEQEYNNYIDGIIDDEEDGKTLKQQIEENAIKIQIEEPIKMYNKIDDYLSNPNDDKFNTLNKLLKSIKENDEDTYDDIEFEDNDELCNMLFKDQNEEDKDFETVKKNPIITELVRVYAAKEALDKIQEQIDNQQPVK